MKIEAEIKDIDRDEVIQAMAARLLGEHEIDEEGEPRYGRKTMGLSLRQLLDKKLEQLAGDTVRDAMNGEIAARLNMAIDNVLRDGWQTTNEYGEPKGPKLDLKARIGEVLSRTDNYNRKSIVSERIAELVNKVLHEEFGPVIEQAKKTLKEQLDTSVMTTVANTIKAALGLR